MADNRKMVSLPEATLNFHVAELHEIHALMDAGEVPRTHNGAKLSAAQRVRWFYHTREAANAALSEAQKGRTRH